MRLLPAVLSSLLLTSTVAIAQTGYNLKTYPGGFDKTLKAADFNHDGKPDLLGYDTFVDSGNVYLNDGNGGFLPPVALPSNNTGVIEQAITVDLKGDGYPDIVACTNQSTGTFNQTYLVVFLNDGTGKFTEGQVQTIAGECQSLVAGDVNMDGHQDVVVASDIPNTRVNPYTYNNQLTTYFGNGTGQLSNPVTVSNINLDTNGQSGSDVDCEIKNIIGGNFYGDNQFSLLVSSLCLGAVSGPGGNGTAFVARGDGTGHFTLQQTSGPVNGYLDYGVAADLNKDGLPDGAYVNQLAQGNTAIATALNTGGGNFTYSQFGSSNGFVGVAVADLNGDGNPDIAASATPSGDRNTNPYPPGGISTFLGSGNGMFTASQSWTIGTASSVIGNIVATDVNGDGAIELITIVNDQTAGTSLLYVYTKQVASSGGCSAPTTANTNRICTPASGSSVSSTVSVTAASNVSGFTLNRLYLDNQNVYQVASQTVNTTLTVANGSHRLVLVSYNNAGQAFSSTSSFTVGSGTSGGCSESTAGVNICAPASGSTQSSPVTVTAAAMASGGNITAIRAYIDNNVAFTVNNSTTSNHQEVSQAVTVAPGAHNLVVIGYQSNGSYVKNSENFTVSGSTPCYPSSAGAKICSPASGATVSSPFTLAAGATAGSGYITAIRVYVDSVAQTLVNNPQQSRSFAINPSITAASGSHSIVVVGYQSTGGSVSASENITVQ